MLPSLCIHVQQFCLVFLIHISASTWMRFYYFISFGLYFLLSFFSFVCLSFIFLYLFHSFLLLLFILFTYLLSLIFSSFIYLLPYSLFNRIFFFSPFSIFISLWPILIHQFFFFSFFPFSIFILSLLLSNLVL